MRQMSNHDKRKEVREILVKKIGGERNEYGETYEYNKSR